MKVKDILEQKGYVVYTIHESKTVDDAVLEMSAHNVGGLVVLGDTDNILGMITERDILKMCTKGVVDLSLVKVASLMSRKTVVALPDDDVSHIMGVMTEKRIRHLPIIENKKLLGIVSIGDVVKAHLEKVHYEVHYLRDYISGKYPA